MFASRKCCGRCGECWAKKNLALSVMSQNLDWSRGYFGDARQVFLPDIYPPFLFREVRQQHGVIACEGSMFKSKFANALTTMFIGALGIASAENKLSVGYGAEAGYMDPLLEKMCARYCRRSLIITRNEESQEVLSRLGVPSEAGTDTAWTFEPHPPEYGRKALADAGWDGRTPILAVCPDQSILVAGESRRRRSSWRMPASARTRKATTARFIFTNRVPRLTLLIKNIWARWPSGIKAFRSNHHVFLVLVAMERLDTRACEALAPQVGGAPVFSSEEYDMYQLVSILRCCSLMVSSRYHAMVTSMPGLVPSAGITMDERIRNLLRERGHEHLLLTVDDPDLESKLPPVMERLAADADAIRDGMARSVVRNLKTMARMGVFLERAVHERYPEFPVRSGVHSWEEYLPPLSGNLERLVETYEGAAAAAAGN